MGGINSFQANHQAPVANLVDTIAGALKAAHSYYGIDTEKQQEKLLAMKTKLEEERQDPNSPASKLAQGEAQSALDFMIKKGIPIKNEKDLRTSISGTPASTAYDYPGFPGPALEKQVAATPGLSAAQIDANKETSPLLKLTGEQIAADSKAASLGFRDDQLRERQDFMAHQKNLAKLKSDTQLNQMVASANNIQTVLSNMQKMGTATKQDYEDLQNIVISNMGVKGQSSAHERASRYASSAGMDAKGFGQWITGQPQDVSQGNPLFDRTKEVAGYEFNNLQKRIQQKVASLTAGNRSIYERRPDLKSDLADAVQMNQAQLSLGFQQPEVSQGVAANTSASQGQDPTVLKYSKMHSVDYGTASAILKQRGYQGASASAQ